MYIPANLFPYSSILLYTYKLCSSDSLSESVVDVFTPSFFLSYFFLWELYVCLPSYYIHIIIKPYDEMIIDKHTSNECTAVVMYDVLKAGLFFFSCIACMMHAPFPLNCVIEQFTSFSAISLEQF